MAFPIANPRARSHVVIVHLGDHWEMKVNGEPLDGVTSVRYEVGVDEPARVVVEFYPASIEIETDAFVEEAER